MQFQSVSFYLFLLAFVVLFHALRRHRDYARQFVILASLVFYASWNIAYVPILLMSTLATFAIARAMAATGDEVRKRRLVIIGILWCLGILALFKYANFVLANAYSLMHVLGWDGGEVYLDLILPIGLSFYTFVNVAYLVDVYRGNVEAKVRLVEYLAPMTFFPHLLSGPIPRTPELFPQFDRLDGISARFYRHAILLIFVGLAKKTLSGMLDPIAAPIFSSHDVPSQLQAWTGMLAYAAQLYADFSGYTDIVLGAALLVGIELPANFNLPYLATSPIDFWRRWHISLSLWIHDYLFLPMVRKLRRHVYLSLLLTWVVMGLWHGAQWKFAAIGVYQGVAIIVSRWIGLHAPDAIHDRADTWWLGTLRRALTFVVVLVGLILFRVSELADAPRIAGSLFASSRTSTFSYDACLTLGLAVLAIVVTHVIDAAILRNRDTGMRSALFWPLAVFAAAFMILFGSGTAGYIYFGF